MIELTNADQIEIDRLCHTGRTLTIRELNDLYCAGLAAGIERAAQVCDKERDDYVPNSLRGDVLQAAFSAADACAIKIRKLMK